MEPEEYIENRLEEQQKWYSKESRKNKNYYYRMKIVIVTLAILIPLVSVITNFLDNYLDLPKNFVGLLTGIFGSAVAILTSISELLKFKEKFINYRTASERLKSENFLWSTRTDPYVKKDAINILVKRVEGIIKAENGDWSSYIEKDKNSTGEEKINEKLK